MLKLPSYSGTTYILHNTLSNNSFCIFPSNYPNEVQCKTRKLFLKPFANLFQISNLPSTIHLMKETFICD